MVIRSSSPASKLLARYPLMTLQTIALIHWQGLKLWLRGVKYRPNPRRRRTVEP